MCVSRCCLKEEDEANSHLADWLAMVGIVPLRFVYEIRQFS